MRVVDARMRRVFTDELVGLVDRGFVLAVAEIRVHQVELALLGGVAEREPGLERLVFLDSRLPVRVVEIRPRALVDELGGALDVIFLAAVATGEQRQRQGAGNDE
jgi:hypothetical protein